MEAIIGPPLSLGALNDATPAVPPVPNLSTITTPKIVEQEIPEGYLVNISGTFVGTLTFQTNANGTTWTPVAVTPAAGGADVTTATAPGVFRVNNRAGLALRLQMTAYTSGTAVAQITELHDSIRD